MSAPLPPPPGTRPALRIALLPAVAVGHAIGLADGFFGGRAPRSHTIGQDVAATAGAVVLRTPVLELIQYLPRTPLVREVPLLVVPSPAIRFPVVDLAPGRSIVEHLVASGQQVLLVSWNNGSPGAEDNGLDTYGQGVLDALDACERITRTDRTALMAVGGGPVAPVLGHLAATGAQDRIASVTLVGPPAEGTAEVRHWASAPSRNAARLEQLLDPARLAVPCAVSLLGTPVDLAKVDRPAYAVGADAGAAVHAVAGLFAGEIRLVTADAAVPDVDGGSWWADHAAWLASHTGAEVTAPAELGGRGLRPLTTAPGTYVLAP